MIKLVEDKIDESYALQSVKTDEAGACVLFAGTTRRFTGDRETIFLSYEVYDQMAVKELENLKTKAMTRWPISRCCIMHRKGEVPIGETSVVVAVSSPHRSDAFEAAAWIMDTLKKEVPIWKQENWSDGSSEWVHPGEGNTHQRQPNRVE